MVNGLKLVLKDVSEENLNVIKNLATFLTNQYVRKNAVDRDITKSGKLSIQKNKVTINKLVN